MNEMTLAEWLDKWYDLYAKPFLKTSTLVSYNGYIKNHIKPFIGQIKLSDLNGIVLQKFFNEKYISGRLDNTGGLSEKTVLNIRQMLHAALRKALENGLISANYVEHVRLQKVSIPDMRVLTVDEQQRLLSALILHQDEYSIGFIILLATGIRIGEAWALKWNNIDFLKKKIMIRKTLQRLPNLNPDDERKTTIVINSPKSDKSIRDIYVNDTVKDSKRRLEYYGLVPKEPSVETVTITIVELTEIKFALQSLSDLELMIVQRNVMGDETLEKISKRLNISLHSVAKVLKASKREDGYISGDNYLVSWCVGHLVGLSSPEMYDEKYKAWNFETLPIILDNWLFSINAATKAQFYKLKELISRSDVDELICATDAGREGECIFRFQIRKKKIMKYVLYLILRLSKMISMEMKFLILEFILCHIIVSLSQHMFWFMI
ncbi:MAG: tyrosine-type recombinase/integrase [Ruminococcus sp.]|nr:tyrosine-type recombinase/integrase [Ruminococcus sp.]